MGIQSTVSMTTHTKSLFALATTTNEPQEKRLKVDIASISEEFEGELYIVSSGPLGTTLSPMRSRRLKKDSTSHLMQVFRTGIYDSHPDADSRFSSNGEVRTRSQK